MEITEMHMGIESEKINQHESIQVKSFARMESACVFSFGLLFSLNPQHFIDQTFKFVTAFLYDFKVLNKVVMLY